MDVHLSSALLLESAIRFVSIGLYLATAIVIFRLRASACRIAGTLAYASKAPHTLLHFPPVMALITPFAPAITIAATMGAVLTWLFALELYGDQGRFDRRRLIPVAAVLVIVLAAVFSKGRIAQALWLLHAFTTVVLMTHVIMVLVRSWRNDLVEWRRLVATPVFLVSAVYSITLGFIQTVEAFDHVPRQPSLLNAGILLFSSALAIIVFGQFGSVLFGDEAAPVATTSKTRRNSPETLSTSDANLAAALHALMQTERLYRTQNLRITSLAMRLRVPEHRLRQLLNYSLGYRNFNAYIGHWRIGEAKDALRDPEQAPVPISTIAIDCGFQSLAPFNRAFKGETGMTPSQYRAEAQSRWGQAAAAAA
jgi:AraC-like DNA-binding protein